MESHGEVNTLLSSDGTLLIITSYEGGHNCCYQSAALAKQDVEELLERLMELHTAMKD